MSSQLSTVNSQPSVELYIEELVLHGFSPSDRHRIGEAVEVELRRLLEDRQLISKFRESSETDHVDAGEFKIKSGATPETIGGHVAESVHRTLIQPHSPSNREV